MVISNATPPDSPKLELASRSGGSIELKWVLPMVSPPSKILTQIMLILCFQQNTGGVPIARVSLSVDGESLYDTRFGTNFTHCGGLLPNSSYTYTIEIENSKGLTSSSSKTFLTSTPSIPKSPTILNIDARPKVAYIDVEAPCDDGGTEELKMFYALMSTFDDVIRQDYVSPGLLSLGNLNSSTSYVFIVQTENDVGVSSWTNASFITATGAPSSPFTSFLFASSTELKLLIIPPSLTGGGNVSIEVTATEESTTNLLYHQNLTCPVTANSLQCPDTVVIDGLDNTTNIRVGIRAMGESQMSSWEYSSYMMDTGADGTIGFTDAEYSVLEGSSVLIEVGRVYGTMYEDEVIFEINSTDVYSSDHFQWECNTTMVGATCYPSQNGTSTGMLMCMQCFAFVALTDFSQL